MFVIVNDDVREIPEGESYHPGRTGPDLWTAWSGGFLELELFWGTQLGGRRYEDWSREHRIVVGELEPFKLVLPPRRVFCTQYGLLPDKRAASWASAYGPALQKVTLGGEFDLPTEIEAPDPWMPSGPLAPDEPGGHGIRHYEPRYAPDQMHDYHRSAMHRAVVYYDRKTGEPIDARGDDYDGTLSDQPNGHLLEWAHVPGGDFLPKMHDWAHFIRQVRFLIAAHEQAPTPMTRRHIHALAAHAMLAFPEHGIFATDASYMPRNMSSYMKHAEARPHSGIPGTWMGRQAGWMAWIVAMDIEASHSDASIAWGKRFLGLCDLAAMPTGFIQANHCDLKPPDQGAWHEPGYLGAQVFEWCLLACGARALARNVSWHTPDWIHRGIRQIQALPRMKYGEHESWPHFVSVAHADGRPLMRLKPVMTGAADPAPWHLKTLLDIL